jgi:hypothetical protein
MFSIQFLKGNLAPSGLQCRENHLAARAVRAAKHTVPFQGSTLSTAAEDLLENIFGKFCIGKQFSFLCRLWNEFLTQTQPA